MAHICYYVNTFYGIFANDLYFIILYDLHAFKECFKSLFLYAVIYKFVYFSEIKCMKTYEKLVIFLVVYVFQKVRTIKCKKILFSDNNLNVE